MKKALLLTAMVIMAGIMRANHWEGDYSQFSTPTTVICVVHINGEVQTSTQLELGAFCNGVVRGSKYGQSAPGGRFIFRLSCWGEAGDVFTFQLYDAGLDEELNYLTCENTIAWTGDSYGSLSNPTVISFIGYPSTTYNLEIPAYGAGNTGGYHLIASPVTEETTPSTDNGFINGNFDLYYFDQAMEDEWINYLTQPGQYANWTINSGKGYLYASEGGTTLKFTGTAYSGDGVIPLVYSEANPSTEMRGWNLIGNPFPNENGAIINKACYVMKADGTDLEPMGANTVIPAMNGVFVKATGTGQSATFIPSNGDNPGNANVVVNILKDRGVAMDRAIVCFDNNGTLPKFMLNPDNTKVYIPQEDGNYAVVNSNIENSLPVNFKANEDGNYTLKIEVNDIRMEYLHLIDNMTGADVDLLVQPDYQFSATSHDYESRFTLVFKATTGVNEQTQQSFCFVNGRSLYFCEDVEGTDFSLVDMTGRTLCNKVLKGNGVDLSSLSQGVYVVRLANGNEVKVQKVVIR